MKQTINLGIAIALIFLCGCCLIFDNTTPIEKRWSARIQEWVPQGTSIDEVRRIMQKHGFKIADYSQNPTLSFLINEEVECTKPTFFGCHEITVSFHFSNGKMIGTPMVFVPSYFKI
jgi:hypothetical protein